MPWSVVKDTSACPVSKPWAVKNIKTGSVGGRCHESKAKAIAQQKALYVHAMSEEPMRNFSVLFAEVEAPAEGLLWFEALPAKTWHTPNYGEVPVTTEKLERMVTNLKGNVRGQEIATDYEHGRDPSKGIKASGWIRDAKVDKGASGIESLWLAVEPTPNALTEIKNKEWRYFSLEWEDEWKHPETQKTHKDVITGGGFTNRPVAKGMMPINFSEVVAAEPEIIAEMAPDYFDEVAPEEHHNPGDDPDPNINRDDSADSKSRIDTPPEGEDGSTPSRSDTVTNNEGGDNTVNEQELRELLGIGNDVDINSTIGDLKTKAATLDGLKSQTDEVKAFAENYPDQAKELSELRELRLTDEARRFSEEVAGMRFSEGVGDDKKDSTKGLSSLAIEEIRKTARKFSDGTANIDDFKSSITAVMENGVVDYGQKGSSAVRENADEVPTDFREARRLFAEKVAEIQANDTEGDFDKAINIAAGRFPKLAEAYARPPVIG